MDLLPFLCALPAEPRPWTFSWPGGMTSRVSCRRRGRNTAGVWMGTCCFDSLPSIFKRSRSRSFMFFFHFFSHVGSFPHVPTMPHVRWVWMFFAAVCNVAGVASPQRMCRRSTWCLPSCLCDLHVNEKWMRWQARQRGRNLTVLGCSAHAGSSFNLLGRFV